jgi:transcriptional regulator with XRE-family HTH domain
MDILNERLLEIRTTLGIKQGEFAKRMGIPQTTLSTIEKGKSPLQKRHIKLLCLAFGVREEWLLEGKGDMMDEEALLSEREKRLLDLFRKLSPTAQTILIQYAEKLVSDEQTLRGEALGPLDQFVKNA